MKKEIKKVLIRIKNEKSVGGTCIKMFELSRNAQNYLDSLGFNLELIQNDNEDTHYLISWKNFRVKEKKKKKYVPFQLCPKCNGEGQYWSTAQWNGETTTISAGYVTCDVCQGVGVIPMAVIR